MEKLNTQGEIKNETKMSQSKAQEESREVPSSSQFQSQEQPLQKKDPDRLPRSFKHASSHPKDQIIGDPNQGIMTRASLHQYCNNVTFISKVEPTCVEQALEMNFGSRPYKKN